MPGAWRAELAECMGWLLEPAQAEMGYPVGTASLEQACRCRASPVCLECSCPWLGVLCMLLTCLCKDNRSPCPMFGRPECAQC